MIITQLKGANCGPLKCIFLNLIWWKSICSYFGVSFSLIFSHFGALGGGLGNRGILGDLYFQKWAPRLDGSTIFEIPC